MARPCSVCGHAQRSEIDKALVANESYREVSRRYGLSVPAVGRHAKGHVGKAIERAVARREETLVQQIERYRVRLETSLTGAESAEDWRGVAALAREVRGFLELVARLTGQLRPDSQVNVAVIGFDPTLQARIVRALAPFPGARQAVVAVLEGPVA
jgi:hypothetical protein